MQSILLGDRLELARNSSLDSHLLFPSALIGLDWVGWMGGGCQACSVPLPSHVLGVICFAPKE